jgi:UDP-N-acetylglucosamine 2-epimerase
LAGALAASKLSIPIAHVEAGLRSFNPQMPEEINRILADRVSELLLCPSETAIENLRNEGRTDGVHLVGDVMLDVLNWAKLRITEKPGATLQDLGVDEGRYVLATVHRSENTNDRGRLAEIMSALNSLNEPVIFPAHPRVRNVIAETGFSLNSHIRMIDPVGYLDMVTLTRAARAVMTDSGGLQKEAYWLGVPCITMRDETEWVETVEAGWNVVVGADREKIVDSAVSFQPACKRPALYGDGFAAEKCVGLLCEPNSANDETPWVQTA